MYRILIMQILPFILLSSTVPNHKKDVMLYNLLHYLFVSLTYCTKLLNYTFDTYKSKPLKLKTLLYL